MVMHTLDLVNGPRGHKPLVIGLGPMNLEGTSFILTFPGIGEVAPFLFATSPPNLLGLLKPSFIELPEGWASAIVEAWLGSTEAWLRQIEVWAWVIGAIWATTGAATPLPALELLPPPLPLPPLKLGVSAVLAWATNLHVLALCSSRLHLLQVLIPRTLLTRPCFGGSSTLRFLVFFPTNIFGYYRRIKFLISFSSPNFRMGCWEYEAWINLQVCGDMITLINML